MNQFVGADFEGTPITQLIGNNNYNNNYNNMNGGYMMEPQPPVSTLFQQPSRDIRNLVNNINNQLDNVSFDLSNKSQESRKSIKYKEETSTDEEEERKKLKRKLKKRKEKKRKMELKELNDEDEETDENNNASMFEWTKYLSNDTKELLLIMGIYFILSLGFVKRTVGEYISYINPNESGKYPFIGILIYGFLLAVLFIAFKKILIH